MRDYRIIGKKVIREDGREKATGALKYMGDLKPEHMLYAKLLFPPSSRGLIKKIDVSEALQCPGVIDVVTASDVPGQNVHGLIFKDQKVFCEDRYNYSGDVIAAVVAVTKEAAECGLAKIRLEVEELEPISEACDALKPDAPQIHPGGNLAAHHEAFNGDTKKAFQDADVVIEHVFKTQYQEHGYLEPENGMARPLKDGGVEVFCACQNCHRCVRDLQVILNLPAEKIIVHSTPIGGGFGGKDDLLLQGILAVCALKCGQPVHIDLTREESFIIGPKRMPMEICMKMAADKDGRFLANEVHVLAACGAYASYGPAILDFSLEHALGTYYFPNIAITGDAAYTNQYLVGAFRGFGNNQMNFALESMIDMMAEKLNMDPIQLRVKNMVNANERYSFGHENKRSNASMEMMAQLEKSSLWKDRSQFKKASDRPWLKRGVGIAYGMQGMGLGNHVRPDASSCTLELKDDGILYVYTSNEDMGQGSITTLKMIAAEAMGMGLDFVRVINGISSVTPDSGPITASRTTYISGRAIVDCAKQLKDEIYHFFGLNMENTSVKPTGIDRYTWQEIACQMPAALRRKTCRTEFPYEAVDIDIGLHEFYSHVAEVAGVEVNLLTGETKLLKVEMITSAGTVINPLGLEGQCEGGAVMSEGYALFENFKTGTRNFQTYLMPVMKDMPDIHVSAIETAEEDGPFGAKGVGEVVSVPGTAAIVNAIYDATGVRFTEIPVTAQKVLMAL